MFLVATYTDGQPTESAEWFCKWLEDASTDFRYGRTYLKGLRYAVFGLGNSVYVGHYNTVSPVCGPTCFVVDQISSVFSLCRCVKMWISGCGC